LVTAWWRRYGGRLWVEVVLSFVVGAAAFVLASLLSAAARSHVPAALLAGFFLLLIIAVAYLAGILYALPVGIVSILAFDWYFLPPLRILDGATVFVLGMFLAMSVIVGALATRAGRRATTLERARGVLAEEQAALRRVATLVAHQPPPAQVFDNVAEEIGRLLSVDSTCIVRYEADATATIAATFGDDRLWPVGSNWPLQGESIVAEVFRTRHSTRMDGYGRADGEIAALARRLGVRSGVGAPIVIGDRLWGAAVVNTVQRPLPGSAEERIANFADLVAIAVSNAETRSQLNASRARVVAAADETRRRLERDLHDGIQQRLVSLALQARATATAKPPPPAEVRDELSHLADGLGTALDELREVSRGIHPAILSEAGLGPALRALARRSAAPVDLDLHLDSRLPEALEVAAYYIASEALTNAVKHARASVIELHVDDRDGALALRVRDNGVGGADPGRGSGIIGLKDRVEALGGRITVSSPPGVGTTLDVQLPTGEIARAE
jgi:signal transduction histidine kinase